MSSSAPDDTVSLKVDCSGAVAEVYLELLEAMLASTAAALDQVAEGRNYARWLFLMDRLNDIVRPHCGHLEDDS